MMESKENNNINYLKPPPKNSKKNSSKRPRDFCTGPMADYSDYNLNPNSNSNSNHNSNANSKYSSNQTSSRTISPSPSRSLFHQISQSNSNSHSHSNSNTQLSSASDNKKILQVNSSSGASTSSLPLHSNQEHSSQSPLQEQHNLFKRSTTPLSSIIKPSKNKTLIDDDMDIDVDGLDIDDLDINNENSSQKRKLKEKEKEKEKQRQKAVTKIDTIPNTNNNNDNENKYEYDNENEEKESDNGDEKLDNNDNTNDLINWNILPKMGDTHLKKNKNNYHRIKLKIKNKNNEEQEKVISYDPTYNKRLSEMDLFFSFNSTSKPSDSLFNAKKRLLSYVEFLTGYLTIRKSFLQKQSSSSKPNFSLDLDIISSIETELKRYVEYNPKYDYSEIEGLLELWAIQSQKFLLQSNSLIFSNDVIQYLLKRKSSIRQNQGKLQQQQQQQQREFETITFSSNSNIGYENKDINNNNRDSQLMYRPTDIDILLLRPKLETSLGWQIALDEPTLNIADFELDISPWSEAGTSNNTSNLKAEKNVKKQLESEFNDRFIQPDANTDKSGPSFKDSQTVKIVDGEDEFRELNDETAPNYILDCMDRHIFSRSSRTSTAINTTTTTSREETPEQQQQSKNPKKKKKPAPVKNTRKSGIVNFFKRKHSQLPNPLNNGNNISSTTNPLPQPSSTAVSTTTHSINSDRSISIIDQNQHTENVWLEDYFCKLLSNYRRIALPTQYILPTTGKTSTSSTPSLNSNNSSDSVGSDDNSNKNNPYSQESTVSSTITESKPTKKTAMLYGKEFLKIRLPFKSNSIPSIFCPWIWTDLTYTKWRAMLREIYRCLIPGGYLIAIIPDMKISNSNTKDASTNFPTSNNKQQQQNNNSNQPIFETTLERDKVFDAMSLEAINKGLHIHPTKHMARSFKEVGYTSIKSTVLSLKTGDLSDDMGCLNEFNFLLNWDLTSRKQLPATSHSPKNSDPASLFDRYVKEHWGKIDSNAGSFRTLYIVGQKPKRQNYK
ncbi:uncharacterized protein NDAI_0F01870 [Naumovozyma dairenensis CBS 421]|uniref:Uncharacterized protein n=1 Tax=Naumovozyma dairenensis (strain ATCC 10597 / BCRC 20456 / CBS 421 / NBRC 0211 / NRRL Y-12639) TaxID=1071378 RepID=G0WCJ4_NAUDC|nr:hypothetical protein NDAI_0F01870 [Naumovozyma dairenensis CBS 421]CCD25505.1 hypothetical protein NDAI_0F01870 [Naumovozyma dairenensis CBS 421]